ncbi:MAG: GGDEF domain-containing protein [Arcobacter sp.]|nr:MAG: GGDEF domain-containing protein [Arcobacter sp.]
MSLSKQLYIIIAFIFFIIFSGNFIISVKNTKEYLEVESSTKAQDTATSLGMSLRPLIKDKYDSEIESIIKAISNSGFYKEIRLEDADFTLTEKELIGASTELDDSNWKIDTISVESKYGRIEKVESDDAINEQLLKLENEEADLGFIEEKKMNLYRYIPTQAYKNGGNITFNFTANNSNGKVNTFANITINKVLVQEQRDIKFEYVPTWFIKMIPINLEEKFSEISNGWNTTAIIYVSPNPGEAYAKLYEQARNSIVYAVIAFIISMIILLIFVRFLLKPLKKIEYLAKDIAKGKFGVIEELPWTTEIKNVAIAMNDMSRKIEAIINKLNKNLESLSKKLSEDELTGLSLKPTLETDMKDMFMHKDTGYIFNIKIHNLAKYAKIHTNNEINKFILSFADILKNISLNKGLDAKTNFETKAYRFFGSEFVVIAKKCDYNEAKGICNKLKLAFENLSSEYELTEVVHIGATPFNQISSIPEMLQAANEAYEKAKLIGPNEFFIRDYEDLSRDMDAWRDLVFDIIHYSNFEVDFINDAYSIDDNRIVMQEAFTKAYDKENNSIPIGTFVSIAEKYEKIIDFDKAVISKVISHIVINSVSHDICINLSLDSISNDNFIIWVQKEILKNKTIANQLVFSITAYSVAKDIHSFKKFCDYIHSSGAKTIVKRFETKFISPESLRDFNLDYIRLARDYTSLICDDKAKKEFIESITELANLLNIKVIAESVKDDRDFEVVKKYKLYGVSR